MLQQLQQQRVWGCIACIALMASCSMVLAAPATPTYPLCSTAKGFASDVNAQFSLTVPQAQLRPQEAFVLVVRPVPYVAGISWVAARINATYTVQGAEVYAMSNANGILQITDQVEPDTEIKVQVINMRVDGATPFVFYAYHSGFRSCSMDITPTASFTGPVPTHIENTNNVATVYLKSVPPRGATGYRMTAVGAVTITESAAPHEDGAPVDTNGNLTPLESTTSVLYFTLRPSQSASATQMIHASILFEMSPNAPKAASPTNAPSPLVGAPDGSTTPPAGSDSAKVAAESTGFFSVFIVLVLVYFTSRSVYNYRVNKITQFPEFVPHHEVFSGCANFCGAFAAQMKNKGRSAMGARGGYSDVNRQEMDAES